VTLDQALATLHCLLYAKNSDRSYFLPDFDREALAVAIDVLDGKWKEAAPLERPDEE
jgi:hypothetical protein